MTTRRLSFDIEATPEDEEIIVGSEGMIRREWRNSHGPRIERNERTPTRDFLQLLSTPTSQPPREGRVLELHAPLDQPSRGGRDILGLSAPIREDGVPERPENHGDQREREPNIAVVRHEGKDGREGGSNVPTHVSIPMEVWQMLLANIGKPALGESGLELHKDARKESNERESNEKQVEQERNEEPRPGGEKWMTHGDIMRLLHNQKEERSDPFDLEPPYPAKIARRPYPLGYQAPVFRKFDGSGSAREHLMSFVDDLGIHRENRELRLKEFSKSLMGRAFTWYTKLCPGSIHTWEELALEFCNKFLEEEGVTHIMDLGKVKQRSNEGLTAFIKRYRDKALQCKETLPEADLVYGCIQNIEGESQLFLSMGGISTFAELLKQAVTISESLRRQGKRLKGAEPVYDVHATESRSKDRRRSYDNHPRREERGVRRGAYQEHDEESKGSHLEHMEELPPISLSIDETCRLVEQWLDEGLLEMKAQRGRSTEIKKRDHDFCFIHDSRTHGLRDCHQVKRLFYKRVKEGQQV